MAIKTDGRKNNGGARKNAGRHEIGDPKKTVNLYVRKSDINFFGGESELKDKIYKFLRDARS